MREIVKIHNLNSLHDLGLNHCLKRTIKLIDLKM